MTVITAGPITVESQYRTSAYGRPITLTPIEHRLLVRLLARRGHTVSRTQLYRDVWKGNPRYHTRTVDMHIARLRVKLGRAGTLIGTVRGVGYRFDVPPSGR